MLSFGMEYERAFSIAFWSARLATGSGPPSRAATMIARESFEKSLPRLASAAPFLCLIEDHLLCPDIRLLVDQLQELLVHTRVVGQLGVERRDEDPAVVLGEHLHLRARLLHPRRANEHAAERALVALEVEVGLEARDLAAVRVPLDGEVGEPHVVAVEQDHSRARAEDRAVEAADRLLEPVDPDEAADRRGLATRDHEPVERLELLRLAHLDDVGAKATQRGRVLAEVALDGQNSDSHAEDCRREAAPSGRADDAEGERRAAGRGEDELEALGRAGAERAEVERSEAGEPAGEHQRVVGGAVDVDPAP